MSLYENECKLVTLENAFVTESHRESQRVLVHARPSDLLCTTCRYTGRKLALKILRIRGSTEHRPVLLIVY